MLLSYVVYHSDGKSRTHQQIIGTRIFYVPRHAYMEGIERILFHSINAYRREHGLDTLIWDERLLKFAIGHSAWMAHSGSLSHRGFHTRASLTGMDVCVENVGVIYLLDVGNGILKPVSSRQLALDHPDAVFEVFTGWVRSPGHRRNMLHENLSRGVVAGYPGRNGSIYVTFFACGGDD